MLFRRNEMANGLKKIGKEVGFIRTCEGNPRNGEGSFIKLTDGRILHAYTEYYGNGWADHCTARISACYSYDDGESWDKPFILFEKDEKAENYMSVSLFRMKNGEVGCVYLRKERKKNGNINCMPYFLYSSDEAKTWSEPSAITLPDGYYCVINDGVIVQRSGRILVPASLHGDSCDTIFDSNGNVLMEQGGVITVAASEDNGRTWYKLDSVIRSPYKDTTGFGEPGIYEYENGDLWLWFRSAYGHQYNVFSKDNGVTWTTPAPNLCFTSPDAPMRVKKVGKYTVAIFNPLSYNVLRTDYSKRYNTKRTPFVCAVSLNDGREFDTTGKTFASGALAYFQDMCYLLEDDYKDSYCYPAICEAGDGFVVSYYHSDGSDYTLNSEKLAKVYYSEIE